MTELQLLIRDSNEMPPVIRADYLQDHGFDVEADWLRIGESQFKTAEPKFMGFGSGTGSDVGGFGIGHAYGATFQWKSHGDARNPTSRIQCSGSFTGREMGLVCTGLEDPQ
jgi:hypothetical protein